MSELLAKTLQSRTFRLALISIAAFGTIVLLLFGYVYWSTASYVLSRSDRAIAAERMVFQNAYRNGGRDGLIGAIKDRMAAVDSGIYLLADPSLRPITGNLVQWPATLAGNSGWSNFEDKTGQSGARSLLRATFETMPDHTHLLVGRNVDDLHGFARKIGLALGCGILLILVLAGVASIFVTRRTVGRIEAINATSREIMERGLDRRIALRGTRDEWDHLAENLNLMLDRIEALMREVRQVTDNVAHDLRTPLARMRGRLEKASHSPREANVDQRFIDDMIIDLDDVLRIFSSLLRISRIEASDRLAGFRTVNLATIAREVVELFDAAAEDKGIDLSVAGEQKIFVTGDRDLLFDATANLVDNAIKHGGNHVTVTVESMVGGACVAVADDGAGIPAEELPHIFKRFYRLERSRGSPGNGLGLSLVAAVAHLHGGRVETDDNQPGLTFRLYVPWTTRSESQPIETPGLGSLTPSQPQY